MSAPPRRGPLRWVAPPLAGVRDYPARVKCASLAWHTLQAALQHRAAETGTATVSTE